METPTTTDTRNAEIEALTERIIALQIEISDLRNQRDELRRYEH